MEKRATFGKLGVILASVGSAVGLGNIWRFPYEAGKNGGGAFLFVYIICVLFLGAVVMLAEFYIGRTSRKNPVGAFSYLAPKTPWKIVGYNGVIAAFLIFGFYSVVSGWTLEYMFQSATGGLKNLNAQQLDVDFVEFSSGTFRPIIWIGIFILITHIIVVSGIKKGIERSSKILMPLLFAIIIMLCIRSILLPKAIEGLEFLFKPDFGKINSTVVLSAVGQAFFSVSVGLGCMITYASYFGEKINLPKVALSVTIIDTIVAILAGVIIFPTVFSFGIEPTKGPELVFITLPNIFEQLPFGDVWSFVFFTLLAVAALTSTISIHEVVTAYFHDEHKFSRKKSALIVTVFSFMLAIICSLSFGQLSFVKLFGMTFFEFFDFVTAKLMLPFGGMFTSVFVGWFIDKKMLESEITNNKTLKFKLFPFYVFLLKYVAPIVIALVFIKELNIF